MLLNGSLSSVGRGRRPPERESAGLVAVMAEYQEIAEHFRFTPIERAAARRIVRNAYSADPKPSRFKAEDGVISCASGGPAVAIVVPAWFIGMLGIVSAIVTGGALWANVIVGAGIALLALGILRLLPLIAASRRYRRFGDWRRHPERGSPGRGPKAGPALGTLQRPPPPPPPLQRDQHHYDDPGGPPS